MDRLALAEGAALLGQPKDHAAVEIAGSFLVVQTTCPLRIALTGAEMRAICDGSTLAWNAVHTLPQGAILDLSARAASGAGGYGYLHLGGGVATARVLGSRSAQLGAGIGAMLKAGDSLPLGVDGGSRTGMGLTPQSRFEGGTIRYVEGPQSRLFPPEVRSRFQQARFRKDHRANRMGQRLEHDGPGFGSDIGLVILSETVIPGDIQIIGDGAPYVLLAECQTTGGYPRIGTVLPCDLPKLVQAPPEAELNFVLLSLEDAVAAERAEARRRDGLGAALYPLIRDPRLMPDLLAYQLVGGVTAGDDL
jgi:allophanate hydrolase